MRPTSLIKAILYSLLFVQPGYNAQAQLNFQFTQASQTGIDINFLQSSINSVINTPIKINAANIQNKLAADNAQLWSLNHETALSNCANNKLKKLSGQNHLNQYNNKRHFVLNKPAPCSVNYAVYSYAIAYPLLNMVRTRPQSSKDLFDIEHFPGKRALPDSPVANLEWALLSYNIPKNEVYQLLSTERGLRLAFEKLDSIKKHIIWWKTPQELEKLLQSNQVTIAAGPNTVFYQQQFQQPMEIIWDGQLLVQMELAIPTSNSKDKQTIELIDALMSDTIQFELAYQFGLGPSNRKTLNTFSKLPQAGQILPFIPTHQENLKQGIWLDIHWHRQLGEKITKRFRQWQNTIRP